MQHRKEKEDSICFWEIGRQLQEPFPGMPHWQGGHCASTWVTQNSFLRLSKAAPLLWRWVVHFRKLSQKDINNFLACFLHKAVCSQLVYLKLSHWQVQALGPLHIVWSHSQILPPLMPWKLSSGLEGMPQIHVLNFQLRGSVKLLTSPGLLKCQIKH